MSQQGKRDLARGWLRAEQLVGERADELAEMSDDAFVDAIRVAPGRETVSSAELLVDRAARRSSMALGSPRAVAPRSGAPPRVVRFARLRSLPRAAWAAVALLAVVAVLTLGLSGRGFRVARRGDDIRRDEGTPIGGDVTRERGGIAPDAASDGGKADGRAMATTKPE